MKKSLYLILLTLAMAQMPSESTAMEEISEKSQKRHRDESSNDDERASKRHADESETGTPVAAQDTVHIRLKNGQTMQLPRQAANIASYFNNRTQDAMQKDHENVVRFEDFDDNVVELTINIINELYNTKQSNPELDENELNTMLRGFIDAELERQGQEEFDIIQTWHFAYYLGVPQLEQFFMQVLAKNICTPEFLSTYQGNEFLSDHPANENFRKQLKKAITEHVEMHFPNILPYTLDQTLGAHSVVTSVCVTPDGKLVSGSWDHTIKVWNLNPETHKYELSQTIGAADNGHTLSVCILCVTPDGKLVSGSDDHTIKVWNLNPETHKYELSQTIGAADHGHTDWICSLCITPDGKLVSGSADETIKVWNLNPETHKYELSQTIGAADNGHTGCIHSLCVTPDGKLVSGSADYTIKVWNLNPETHKYELSQTIGAADNGHTNWVYTLCVTPDGKLVSGSTDKTIKVWTPPATEIEEIITRLKQKLVPATPQTAPQQVLNEAPQSN